VTCPPIRRSIILVPARIPLILVGKYLENLSGEKSRNSNSDGIP
jgi:hypothetical protein